MGVRIAPLTLLLRALIAVSVVLALSALRPRPATGELRVYRLEGTTVRPLRPGDSVAPGDVLQAAAHVPNDELAWIYSRDGNGTVTLHAAALPGGRWRVTPRAFQLDDAPGCEDFILFTGDHVNARARLEKSRCDQPVPGATVFPLRRPNGQNPNPTR